jgi:S-adenosylmethionine-dependent methyltransferase
VSHCSARAVRLGAVAVSPDRTGSPTSRTTFDAGRHGWLGGLGNVRNVVRQELIARQLDRHLPAHPVRILDVGAGQGTQAIRLARCGHTVIALEPDAAMRDAFATALSDEDERVRDRVSLRAGAVDNLDAATSGERFDAVLSYGVLMYLPESAQTVAAMAASVPAGGLLALAVRTTVSAVWRQAARQDWAGALAAFRELDSAQRDGRDMRYTNEIGAPARADHFDRLVATAAASGLVLERWYGVRTAVDLAELDPAPPDDPAELAALLEVEERLGNTDPYRALGQLTHLVFRRPPT